ncbi:hypothetical protein [Aeromonas veronii]|uniref:hypothetical protein n=1 Tax=Aeromonas veronii TaxID=654 RepID=UPI003B9E6C1A
MSQTLTVQAMQRLEQYSNALAKAYGIPVNALAKQFSVTGPVETGLRAALHHPAVAGVVRSPASPIGPQRCHEQVDRRQGAALESR